MMGSPEDELSRAPDEDQFWVTISQDFYIGLYEVTQAQWEAVMGENPIIWEGYVKGDDYPIYFVSMSNCEEFLTTINTLGLGTFRLPTEAEWEYACRAGSTTLFHWGTDLAVIGDYAWLNVNAEGAPHEVGLKLPNNWGLFDMMGNVYEWCSDWYGEYPTEDQIDYIGPTTGDERVVRGGNWYDAADRCRSASRYNYTPTNRYDTLGFRLVRSYP